MQAEKPGAIAAPPALWAGCRDRAGSRGEACAPSGAPPALAGRWFEHPASGGSRADAAGECRAAARGTGRFVVRQYPGKGDMAQAAGRFDR